MKIAGLKREIAERENARGEISRKVNGYCEKKFGIENFFSIADKHFERQTSKFQVCLSRQVPTPNIEHLALYLSAKEWGIEPLFLSLIRDTFPQNSTNEYKKSLVLMPLLVMARNGNLAINCKRISPEKNLQGAIFSELKSNCGKSLPDFHWEMMKKALPEISVEKDDLSGFFSELFLNAKKNLPEFVFEKFGRYEKKRRLSFGESFSETENVRPPADWYYFFYLLLFLDGSRGLASTVDEDPEVILWFEENNKKIQDICGFAPLILSTPLKVNVGVFHSKLNEVPQKALGGNGFMRALPRPTEDDVRFFDIMKHYEEELIAHS